MLSDIPKLLKAGTLPALVSSCTVYTPMQPHAPMVRARGEGEAQLEVQFTGRAEVKAAYSPVKHVLVLGGATARPGIPLGRTSQDKFSTLQYEAGLGAYFPLANHWTIQGMAGTGAGSAQRTVSEFGLLLAFSNNYDARYHKEYGQLGFTHQAQRISIGFGYRLTQVGFKELSAQDLHEPFIRYQLPLDKQLRHEPYAFCRHSLGTQNRWQLQVSTAWSVTVPGRGLVDPYTEVAHRARFNRGASLLLGAGVIFRPSLWSPDATASW
ncbi:hypothetical protein KBK19_12625 [Microvirga sp. STR05]|uniref:Outer membrane protein beta-barrel domain-containing protein n=1 Tax=Hymenobacter duratus TaxID=2771356 RepID=A0ABR8JGA3_9BACT|nr:hypothetical protein [Hymenobacter duratus]MBD2715881.1 hypothetical protein [Hymenobacter duratus]MBR7950793.1 hypothetical protein [Microvirga sp. STR05]